MTSMTVAYLVSIVMLDWFWVKEQWVLSSQRLAKAKAAQDLECEGMDEIAF